MKSVLGVRPEFGRLATRAEAWSPAALRTATPNRPVVVWGYETGEIWPSRNVEMTTHQYLDYVAAAPPEATKIANDHGSAHLYGFIPVDHVTGRHEQLRSCADALGHDWGGVRTSARLYASRAGTSSGLHWDGAGTTLIQLAGTKEGIVFAPSAGCALEPFPEPAGPNSGVDPFSPGRSLPPSIRFTLEPGDWIRIPRGWWHCLRSSSPISVSVNLWDHDG